MAEEAGEASVVPNQMPSLSQSDKPAVITDVRVAWVTTGVSTVDGSAHTTLASTSLVRLSPPLCSNDFTILPSDHSFSEAVAPSVDIALGADPIGDND